MSLSSNRSANLVARRLQGHLNLDAKRRELTNFVESFSAQATEETYNKWLKNPVTQKVLSLLDELSFLPAGVVTPLETGDAGIDYGVTLGLQFATRLARNPALFLPVFVATEDGEGEAQDTTDTAYTDPPESGIMLF